ncbi:putative cysteine desulfurase [Phytophthora citrophthora]|uniref:Cysteine desulfurase n=1 Tax=Phytophthora citrophthora TaxID=4793 RepID=A0AAD9G5L3_9STRA|nr:putative cysteine desulfurase [Phytophthora citrophthora]
MLRHSIDESSLPRRSLLAVAPPAKEDDKDLLSSSSNNPFTMTDSSSIDLEAERVGQQKTDDDDDKHETASETSSSSNSIIGAPAADVDMEIALGVMKEADRRMTVRTSIATDVSSVDGDDVQVEDEEDHNEIDVQLLHDIADNMIGRNVPFETPFGTKAQCYADYTASGKAIESIETFIRNEVMPTYGNTHTTTSVTGLQTTSFREEARQIIGKAVNARLHGTGTRDVVLFTGQGCTSAINKFITALGLNTMRRHHRPHKRPVIFTCPFSHHSNLLPWRELYAVDVVEIPEAKDGGLNLKELELQLQSYRNRDLKIGTFAAASNLTGMLADVDKVSKLLHKYGALSCWDYATCAPYVEMDMNPKDPAAYKDAVFFSGHKFVGGPGSPGVLVVKKNLMSNEVPTMPGGGTVLFVTEKAHSYLANKVEREEGGTPDILGSIRLGLAFQIKQRVGPKNIMNLERQHVRHVREVLGQNENIILLGHENVDQLPVFSFLVRFGDRFLHHNFVCALLNDLFGVQARGGCQCAGPFGARLLGLSREHITALGYAVVAKDEVLKPGVARMSFPYFADEDEVEYILEAVIFVATHGWKFLPQYEYDPHNGAWRHVSRATAPFPSKKFLASMQLDDVETVRQSVCAAPVRSIAVHRRENLDQAAALADACIEEAVAVEEFPEGQKLVPAHEGLRWFVYPHEAVAAYKEKGEKPALTEKIEGPCQPQRYLDGSVHEIWEGVPSLGKMKRSLMGRIVLKMFMQAELEAMKDKRTDVEKSVLSDEEAMCAVFGGSQKCQ